MRKLIFNSFFMASLLLAIASCNKDNQDETIAVALKTTTDVGNADNAYQEADEAVVQKVEVDESLCGCGISFPCANITWAEPRGTFPNVVTLDFGTDGCAGPNGRIFRGVMTVNISGPMNLSGSTRSISFSNFSIDSVALTGNVVVTNISTEGDVCKTFTRDVTNATATFPDGTLRSWEAHRTRTQIAGCDTPNDCSDDIWSITGTASGQNRAGNMFTSTITTPLIKARNCRWIESGVVEFTITNRGTRILNFGNGGCDNQATVSLNGGATRNITLRN